MDLSYKICGGCVQNATHNINMAELDAVLRGINFVLQWKAATHLFTDSACVHRWLSDSLTGKARLATKAANEMLIRRRLDTFVALIHVYNLSIDVSLVRFDGIRVDPLTRVPLRWLHNIKEIVEPVKQMCVAAISAERMVTIYNQSGHPGIRRTLYFVRQINHAVSKAVV